MLRRKHIIKLEAMLVSVLKRLALLMHLLMKEYLGGQDWHLLYPSPSMSSFTMIRRNFLLVLYPTRHRSDRRKIKQDLHGVNEAGCSDQLKSMVPSSSGQIRGTHNRIANSMELSDDAYGAEGNQGMNDIVITGALPGHCSTSGVVESNCVGNGISLASDSQAKTEETTSKPHPRRFGRRRLVRNGLISPSNVKGKLSLASEESHASFSGISSFYKGKGIDLSGDSQNKSEHTLLHQCQFDAPWKNSDQGMLVRNGFISPLNMGESRNAAHCEWDGFERVDTGEVQDGILSPQLHVTADSVSRQAHEIKENIFLNDIVQTNGQDDAKSSFMSSRELLLPCKETIIGGKDIADVRPADDNGFREMHRRAGRSVQPLSQGSSSNQKHDSMLHSVCETDSLEVACPSPFTQKSTSHQFQRSFEVKFEHNPDNGSHSGEKRLARGKRKTGYNHKLIGECSSSACIGPDGLRPEIPGETSTAKSTRGHILQSHAIITEPIIDADELPSLVFKSASHCNISCLSSESVARAQQVESDEILARRLQEHFSNELSNFGGSEEIDATIAWTLQEEEDAQLASSIRNRGQSHPRSPSIAHLYRQYPRQSSQDSSTQSASRARITPSARMTRLQRNVRRDLDLETRLNFSEGLDMAFDSGTDLRSTILQVQRDFNENDYEMLLALDEDNHQHMGASLHQINRLPQSVIQVENVEEACTICLEKPSIGDTIRHLPCLHRFHKDCIDTWLRRRTSCPVCKSEIT